MCSAAWGCVRGHKPWLAFQIVESPAPNLLVSLFLLYVLQEVQDAPKIMGPDALIKAKIKQTRFRWAGAVGCPELLGVELPELKRHMLLLVSAVLCCEALCKALTQGIGLAVTRTRAP